MELGKSQTRRPPHVKILNCVGNPAGATAFIGLQSVKERSFEDTEDWANREA